MLGSTLLCAHGTASSACYAHPGAQQSAVVQDLIARHNLPSPAHPSGATQWHSATRSLPQHSMHSLSSSAQCQHSVSDVMLHANLVTMQSLPDLKPQHNEATAQLRYPAKQIANQASVSPATQQQICQLQAALSTINVTKAVARHPDLLLYSPTTLQQHMQQFESLVGAEAAASMVAKMPQLLHYKSSTLAAKLDLLYDLLPEVDVSKVVVRSPFLLGISTETLKDRLKELQVELAGANVQRMAEYCPSILECKIGKVVGNVKALRQLLPQDVDFTAVVQHMPSLLLSDMKKVEDKYMRLQILCMHTPRWRRDLLAMQQKPATLARLLGVSYRVIDRLAFLLEHREPTQLGAVTVLLMSKAKFEARFDDFDTWLQHRDAAQHANAWQFGNPMDALSGLDQPAPALARPIGQLALLTVAG